MSTCMPAAIGGDSEDGLFSCGRDDRELPSPRPVRGSPTGKPRPRVKSLSGRMRDARFLAYRLDHSRVSRSIQDADPGAPSPICFTCHSGRNGIRPAAHAALEGSEMRTAEKLCCPSTIMRSSNSTIMTCVSIETRSTAGSTQTRHPPVECDSQPTR